MVNPSVPAKTLREFIAYAPSASTSKSSSFHSPERWEAEARAVLRCARRLFVGFSDDRRIVVPLVVVVLPFELPARYELIVNLKTAKAIGLMIPDSFVLLADEVIE